MGKVFSVHEIAPSPGVELEEFEQLLLEVERIYRQKKIDGWTTYILKGERGEKAERFAYIHVFESIEVRNLYYPIPNGEPSEATRRVYSMFPSELLERWYRMVEEKGESTYTDFISIEE